MALSPEVSVVVVVHNMHREAPRTLLSLSSSYQRHIPADDYEVIVIDNGSTPPVNDNVHAGLAGNFRLFRMDPPSPSPARAINRGLSEARGNIVGVLIDGARIATPGLLHFARHGARMYERAVIVALGWYLGFDLQRWAIEAGYSQQREDALLDSVDWPRDGYRLFEIGTPDESSVDGWFQPVAESNALFLRREMWDLLDGVDERFDLPGGGMLNPDTFGRAMELPQSELVVLLGEATFHQLHGGIATNSRYKDFLSALDNWHHQYEAIRGHPYSAPKQQKRCYIGTLPPAALPHFARSLFDPVCGGPPPLGLGFDRDLWAMPALQRPSDPSIASLVDLANREFRARRFKSAAAVARLGRARAPDEPAVQRLLSHAGPSLRRTPSDQPQDAAFHAALGTAHLRLGEPEAASREFRTALSLNGDLAEAHIGLSHLRMPGEGYYAWLDRLHAALRPDAYVEIGINKGSSLALARPPTLAIGVDPTPNIAVQFRTETMVYPETSDEFFQRRRLEGLLKGQPLRFAFIDGLHLFEQALRDFINLETYCGPRSVVLFHDTFPLDEVTQSRERRTQFHTGDIWKVVLCLKEYRPDLDVFTIATPWSGLTVVTGLGGGSDRLADAYDEAVGRFVGMPFSDIEPAAAEILNVVPNDWQAVTTRLRERGVL